MRVSGRFKKQGYFSELSNSYRRPSNSTILHVKYVSVCVKIKS